MPRVARIVVPGLPHHVTQRGNNRQEVFFVDEDRVAYLKFLARQCQLHRVAILGYCLMTNHVHHVLVPSSTDGLARAIGRTHWQYTQHINRVHARSGHLWQNRFYSAAMDDDHALLAMRYVERNPLRARLCRVASRYRWSSAAAHCDGRDPLAILDLKRWNELNAGLTWADELGEPIEEKRMAQIRRSTHTGRPLVSDRIVAKLERALGRRVHALPSGRPATRKITRRK
jgi:putative transposase